jgi:hypothetical protein
VWPLAPRDALVTDVPRGLPEWRNDVTLPSFYLARSVCFFNFEAEEYRTYIRNLDGFRLQDAGAAGYYRTQRRPVAVGGGNYARALCFASSERVDFPLISYGPQTFAE